MLDYAANAVVFWPMEQLRAEFEQNSGDPASALGTLLDVNDPNLFWQRVKTNLQVGKIRMLFVADVIPEELKRIVEFLNEQMDPAEVLAVEIKHYEGQGIKTLVPRVYGLTEEAKARKRGGGRQLREWNEELFFGELEKKCGAVAATTARTILEWARPKAKITFGTGGDSGSIYPLFTSESKNRLLSLWTYGKLQMQLGETRKFPPFSDESLRRELVNRLNQIPGVSIPADKISQYPGIPFDRLADKTSMDQFWQLWIGR